METFEKKPLIIEENLVYLTDAYGKTLLITDFHKTVEINYGRKSFAQVYDSHKIKIETGIAYSPNGYDYYTTTNELSGVIKWVGDDKWIESSCGWDAFLVPTGFKDVTLGQLYFQELLTVNLRSLPIIELYYDHINKTGIGKSEGIYEIHITIENFDPKKTCRKTPTHEFYHQFMEKCNSMGLRCLYIVEEDDEVELQTAQYRHFKTSKDAHLAMKETAKELSESGFVVKRSRLEAMAFNPDVPVDGAISSKHYFEFHGRIGQYNKNKLPSLGGLEGCHYSQVKGKWFINQRVYGRGRKQAMEKWKYVVDMIERHIGRKLEKLVKPEYCIYDSELFPPQ